MKICVFLLLVAATTVLLGGCASVTLSQGGTVYYSTLATERAKMAKQAERRAKEETKRLEKILKAIDQREKARVGIIAERAKQQALREEIARRMREQQVRYHTHR